jgi:hypothetical protein
MYADSTKREMPIRGFAAQALDNFFGGDRHGR